MPEITIRPLLNNDEDEVVDLVLGVDGIGISPSFNWPEEALRPEVRHESGWGLWVDDELAGFVLWRQSGIVREISSLAMHLPFRRQKLMRRMLMELFDAYGHSVWMLEVHVENQEARALYASLGFEEVNRRRTYYRDGGDALVLRRSTL